MKREKRLEKGINSIKYQISLHEKKIKEAEELGQLELVDYYHKDILRLIKQKELKEEKLEKENL